MVELKRVLSFFKKGDVQKLRDFIDISGNSEDNLKAKLLDFVINEESPTDSKGCEYVYGSLEKSKFSHLKKRLEEDIYKIVFLQNNKKLFENILPQKKMECKKLLLIGEWLINKGARSEGEESLKKALKIANQYSLYVEKIAILDILRIYKGIDNKIKGMEDLSISMYETIEEFKCVSQMKEYAFKIGLLDNFKSNIDLKKIEKIEYILSEADDLMDINDASNVYYWYCLMYFNYNLILKEFETALSYHDKILLLLNENPDIYGKQRYLGLLINKSNLLFRLGRFDTLATFLENEIEPILRPNMSSEFRCFEMQLRLNIELENFEACELYLAKLLKHNMVEISYNLNRVLLYKTFYHFRKGEKEKALLQMSSVQELGKDKAGWLFGIYYLEILSLIDLEEYGQASYRIENLNHLLYRQKDRNVVRIKLILKIIKSLVRKPFAIEQVVIQHESNLLKLKSNKGDYYWDCLGYEVVRFEDWLDRKFVKVGSI